VQDPDAIVLHQCELARSERHCRFDDGTKQPRTADRHSLRQLRRQSPLQELVPRALLPICLPTVSGRTRWQHSYCSLPMSLRVPKVRCRVPRWPPAMQQLPQYRVLHVRRFISCRGRTGYSRVRRNATRDCGWSFRAAAVVVRCCCGSLDDDTLTHILFRVRCCDSSCSLRHLCHNQSVERRLRFVCGWMSEYKMEQRKSFLDTQNRKENNEHSLSLEPFR